MAKKHKHEEHENHERWVVSYADFMTLLFAFFVVLYASSRVDTNKMVQTTESMRWALNFKGTGGVVKMAIFKGPQTEGGCATNLGSGSPSMTMQKQVVESIRRKIEKALRPILMQRNEKTPSVSLEVENGRLHIRLAAQRFFDPASATLRPESLAVLDAIAEELGETKQNVRVEGHTDDEPIRSSRFRNNWDLSASRAATVVSYLEQAHKLDPLRLSAAGMGSTRPLESNDTQDHKEMNRRIELVLELPANDPRGYGSSTR
jgi:chemotaxis protein MotB